MHDFSEEAEREGGYAVYATILKAGQKEKCCKACDRKLKDSEMAAFEKTVRGPVETSHENSFRISLQPPRSKP